MSTRPTRSASIPIGPRSSSSLSPAQNIETVISMPLASPSRPRVVSAQANQQNSSFMDDHRGLGISYGARGSTSGSTSASSLRPTARSATLGSLPSRSFIRNQVAYEPRVIRVSAEGSRGADPESVPSTSPLRTRRVSGANGRGSSLQRSTPGYSATTSHTPLVSFPRPSYLDYSALRHMLQTDAPPTLPPSRKNEHPPHEPRRTSAIVSTPSDSDEESNVSPPRELPSAPLPTLSQDQILWLPTRWCDQVRHALLSISGDGRDLTYHGGPCHSEKDAAAARTEHPIPPSCGIYYYEMEILSKGPKGHISIGFAGRDVKLSKLPGWEKDSWGYHGDDGNSFAAEKSGTKYGPTYGTGDIIGCGIDFTTYRAFFTKNGQLLGPVFENVGKNVDLYPSVGLRHTGEVIRANFGHEPFKFDIDFHVSEARNHVWSNILSTPLRCSLLDTCSVSRDTSISPKELLSESQTKETIHSLILSYLEHHGYGKTVRAFEKQREADPLLKPSSNNHQAKVDGDIDMTEAQTNAGAEANDDMERRTKIVRAVIAGDIDFAINETRLHHPSAMDAEDGLMLFKLRCRKFVELILEAAELKKKMKRLGENITGSTHAQSSASRSHDESAIGDTDGLDADGMDIDDEVATTFRSASANGYSTSLLPVPGHSGRRRSSISPSDGMGFLGNTLSQYESALHQAISYGQTLSNEYKDDARPEVRQNFKRTFAIVAWEDPLSAGGVVADVVSPDAKVALANELNQAILKSQGRPPIPLLEALYRHTAVCITQLGLMGVGGATFADMQKEFLGVS